jgi:hypothetical protein
MHRSSGTLLHLECRKGKTLQRAEDMSSLHSRKIRLFSPKELLRIFGFPDSFNFPPSMELQHRYRLIGQSINVLVVRAIMHAVLCISSHPVGTRVAAASEIEGTLYFLSYAVPILSIDCILTFLFMT